MVLKTLHEYKIIKIISNDSVGLAKSKYIEETMECLYVLSPVLYVLKREKEG